MVYQSHCNPLWLQGGLLKKPVIQYNISGKSF